MVVFVTAETSTQRAARLAREATHRAVERGLIVKPPACEKCSTPTAPGLLNAYLVDDERPLDVTWLCRKCYASLRPMKRRKQLLVRDKCPDYQVMKADYVAGMPLERMARKYGISTKQTVWHTLRARAGAHGEWPLPRPKGMVQANALWDLVKAAASREHFHAVRRRLASEPVWVTQKAANEFAPRCRADRSHKEHWSREAPIYHLLPCKYGWLSDDLFPIDRDEAEDWGYMPCKHCIIQFHPHVFAREAGLDGSLCRKIENRVVTHITFVKARAMLSAIGEPIPDSLYLPYELESRREQRRIYDDYLQHQRRAG